MLEDGKARLNHASFGATPAPVLAVQRAWQDKFLRDMDAFYFTGGLLEEMDTAGRTVAQALGVKPENAGQVCMLENATACTQAVTQRWSWSFIEGRAQPGDAVLMLSYGYKASMTTMRALVERVGGKLVVAEVPFPVSSPEQVVAAVDKALRDFNAENTSGGARVRYAMVDHISSQPAILLPLEDMVKTCRQHGVEEIAVDGAHAIGSLPPDEIAADQLGVEFYYSNLHKWGCCPPCSTAMWVRPDLQQGVELTHPLTSWHHGEGFRSETLFTGSRDYSAIIVAPHAVSYLHSWRSGKEGESMTAHNHRRCVAAANALAEAWGVPLEQPSAMMASQAMVPLPEGFILKDIPGTHHAPTRTALRDRFGVEAALGNFPNAGAFVRLSVAPYTTEEDIARLRDGVLELAEEQRRGGAAAASSSSS